MSEGRLAGIIGDPDVEALALVVDGEDRGLIELDFRTRGECELAFLGLVPGATGQGLGAALIGEAIERAFKRRIARLWLHTCTLDHPAAMRLYLRAGFRAYRRAIEIADDPRLTGAMPRDAAPWHPVL
jgi:GNAT superfamily N-acetyltransferase